MNSPIVLHLDRSDSRAIYFERDGQRVSMEAAFREGFRIEPNDAPAVLTLVAEFLKSKDAYSK